MRHRPGDAGQPPGRACHERWHRHDARPRGAAPGLLAGGIPEEEELARHHLTVPEFIAPMITWLCTDAAANVTGEVFSLNGGVISRWSQLEDASTVVRVQPADPRCGPSGQARGQAPVPERVLTCSGPGSARGAVDEGGDRCRRACENHVHERWPVERGGRCPGCCRPAGSTAQKYSYDTCRRQPLATSGEPLSCSYAASNVAACSSHRRGHWFDPSIAHQADRP